MYSCNKSSIGPVLQLGIMILSDVNSNTYYDIDIICIAFLR